MKTRSASEERAKVPNPSVDEEPEGDNDDDDIADTQCSLFGWRPAWLQRFATAKFFAINFSIVGILQGAMFTYTVGVISTLEKRYAFESSISGFILIADNFSSMIASPIIGYLGSKYNRSAIIAVGEFIVALAGLANYIPYYIYGARSHLANRDSGRSVFANSTVSSSANSAAFSNFELCSADNADPECSSGAHATVILAVVIFWISSFLNGLGYTAFYTIGLPYIDDNIPKKNSAMYISFIASIRLCGPTLGFLLSSFCLSLYENPFVDPGITREDPRWIGAWWLGFLILGTLVMIFSLPMLMFPLKFREIPKKKKVADAVKDDEGVVALPPAAAAAADTADTADNGGKKTKQGVVVTNKAEEIKFDGAWKSLKRLSTNYVLLFHVWGGVFRIIGLLGYYIIKPKYMELQYRQTASSASLFTGATGVVTMVIGNICGGLFIKYVKPRAKYLAAFIVMVEFFSTAGIFSAMFLSCPTPQYAMLPGDPMSCNANCHCSTKNYKPMCGPDGVTNYFSPCFAGCTSYDSANKKFGSCSCFGSGGTFSSSSTAMGNAFLTAGRCPNDCGNKFPIYITVLSVCNLIAAFARTGDTIITMRSVEPRDKNFAMGLAGMIFSVFAFIPYPMIYGFIIDSTCLVWEKACGKTGNCWLYDMDKFRVYLHVSSLIFIFIGISLELGMVYFADRIKYLYDDEEDEEEDNDGGGVKREKFELKDAENGRDLNANVTVVTNGNMENEEDEEEDLRLQQPKNGNIENFGLIANLGSSNTADASVNK